MKNRSWKAAETRFARDVGNERKPCDGTRDGADFEDSLAVYQLKVRRAIPGWLWNWLTGIRVTGQLVRKVGVLVLKHPRQPDAEALVVLTWADWVDLHGDARKGRHGEEKGGIAIREDAYRIIGEAIGREAEGAEGQAAPGRAARARAGSQRAARSHL